MRSLFDFGCLKYLGEFDGAISGSVVRFISFGLAIERLD